MSYSLGQLTLRVCSDRSTVKFYKGAQFVKVQSRKPKVEIIRPTRSPAGQGGVGHAERGGLQWPRSAALAYRGELRCRLAEGPLTWSRVWHS